MPSPPTHQPSGTVPPPPIDVAHLARMTLDDRDLTREVLVMFRAQASELLARLGAGEADGAALAHKLKGSARAIGAFRLADCAERLEAEFANGSDAAGAICASALARLAAELAEVCRAAETILARA